MFLDFFLLFLKMNIKICYLINFYKFKLFKYLLKKIIHNNNFYLHTYSSQFKLLHTSGLTFLRHSGSYYAQFSISVFTNKVSSIIGWQCARTIRVTRSNDVFIFSLFNRKILINFSYSY